MMINLEMPKKAKIEKKYPRVLDEIRTRINRGLLTGALPGVKQLALEFDVNFMTVDKAIRMLEVEGLVYRIPRKGSFVSRLRNIALVFNDPNPRILASPFYTRLLMGLQGYLGNNNCSLLFENLTEDIDHRAALLARKIDGMILLCTEMFTLPEPLRHIPCVQAMGMVRPDVAWDHITYDNDKVGKIAAEYLLARGHRRVAFINSYAGKLIRVRGDVFAATMAAGGGEAVNYPALLNFSTADIEAQMEMMLKDPNRPTAIFSPVDDIMLTICNFLSRYGYRPGNDFDMIGCDNEKHFWQGMAVHPASIDIGVEAIGVEAGKRLFYRIAHPEESRYVRQLDPELIISSRTDFSINDINNRNGK